MKKVNKVIIGLFIILLFLPFFSSNAISATTIGDTTFPADVGKTYTWKYTYPSQAKGMKRTFKSESIERVGDLLVVNCTMRAYMPPLGWQTLLDNEYYIAVNNTLNTIFFGSNFYPLVIPTPINLTTVANAFSFYNYSIVDNTIIDTFGPSTEKYTYNTNGFLTSHEGIVEGELNMKFILDVGDAAAVPFSHFFFIFMVISVIALVYLKKQKIR